MKSNSTAGKAFLAASVFLGVVLVWTPVVSGAQAGSCLANYPARYMGGEAEIIEAPNGALIYDKALELVDQIVYTEPTVENLGDGIWVIGGYSIANFFVIEAPEGLIVYDTGDYAEEGRHVRHLIEEKISKRPIKAIIYSHSHYALGGGAMVDDPDSVIVIGHKMLNQTVKANLEGGGAPSAIPELGPVLSARGAVQSIEIRTSGVTASRSSATSSPGIFSAPTRGRSLEKSPLPRP